ncbi:hypothetical protein SEA_KROMP_92 [Streptomyces phage Kromp]|uniref:Uncharacterized protein n=1 Tax=Streptomyces phage Kromp TaxID=2315619 RepID=A0A386K8Z3_9CAUD|nr:hypothetical protein SEA_KROMP_92 [Streptomyces phage Kromp]
MPRIQILPLPEGASDERPPFALVIDQVPADTLDAFRTLDVTTGADATADSLGARTILMFADTIEIPANDTSAYATPTMVIRVEGDADSGSADLADQIRRGIEHAQATYGRSA